MKTYLEPAEIAARESAAINLRDRLLTRLLFHTGCQVSEALALTVEDEDSAGDTITIQHLKSRLRLYCRGCEERLVISHTSYPKCIRRVKKALPEERG